MPQSGNDNLKNMFGEDSDWPLLDWFLRGPALDRVALAVIWGILAFEFVVLATAHDNVLGYFGLCLGGTGVLVSRRRRSLGLTLVVAGSVLSALLAREFVAFWFAVVLMVLSVTLRGTRPIASAMLSSAPVYLSIAIRMGGDFRSALALVSGALCITAATTGSGVRAQQRYLEAVKQRAIDALTSRELEVERRVAEERLHIARDLHDAVGHEVAVISMHLGVAEVSLPGEAESSRAALGSAREAIRRVLLEIQQILDILRRGQTDENGTAPMADFSQVPELVRSFQAAGTDISFRFSGSLPELDQGVSAAAYRIVQEALTNGQRHGRGRIELRMQAQDDQLVIDVRNERSLRPASLPGHPGYGLIGMRERAESTDGAFEILEYDNMFHVHAVLNVKEGHRQ